MVTEIFINLEDSFEFMNGMALYIWRHRRIEFMTEM